MINEKTNKIDNIHQLVILNDEIIRNYNEMRQLERDIKENNLKLKDMFERTLLYKELKEIYSIVTLANIDEDETTVEVQTKELDVKFFDYDTQRIANKLKFIK
jgi:hypothetical protein